MSPRQFTILTPLVILTLFEFLLREPRLLYYYAVLMNLVLLATLFLFLKKSGRLKQEWHWLILPWCFLNSLILYSTVVISGVLLQALIFGNLVFLHFYLKNTYCYLFKPGAYQASVLENASSYGNFFVILFLTSGIFGIQAFLNISWWILIIFLIPAIVLVFYQVFWANKISLKTGWLFIGLGCLILLQIIWALSFLPFNHHVMGLVTAICYYMFIGLTRFKLRGALTGGKVKLYLMFGLSSIFLIILTS